MREWIVESVSFGQKERAAEVRLGQYRASAAGDQSVSLVHPLKSTLVKLGKEEAKRITAGSVSLVQKEEEKWVRGGELFTRVRRVLSEMRRQHERVSV